MQSHATVSSWGLPTGRKGLIDTHKRRGLEGEVRRYVISELVRTSKDNRLKRAAEFPEWAERSARSRFRELREQFPDTYFELTFVEHTETCLEFGPIPDAGRQAKGGEGGEGGE